MAGSRVGSTVDSAWLVALWPLRWRVSHSHSTHTRTCMHTSTHMQMAHMHTQAHLCPCPHHVHTQYACTHMHTPTHSTHMHRQHACTRAGTYSVAPQAKAALLGQKEPCPLPGGTGPNKPADGWTGPCPAGRLQTPGLAAALCTASLSLESVPAPLARSRPGDLVTSSGVPCRGEGVGLSWCIGFCRPGRGLAWGALGEAP